MERKEQYRAYKSVKTNKGAPGVGEMTIEAALTWWREHNHKLMEKIQRGKHTPSPVRRVEIPKPDGEAGKLGIPTDVDQATQQAMTQQLAPIYEPRLSENNVGYRLGRGAKDVIQKIKKCTEQGYTQAVILNLSKYFDTLNHTTLLNLLRKEIKDEQVMQMIRNYLKNGAMENGGKFSPRGQYFSAFRECVSK